MYVTIRQIALSLTAAAVLGGGIATAGFFAGMAAQGSDAPASAVATAVTSPSPAPVAVNTSGAELMPGTGTDPRLDAPAYRCKAGYAAIQVPVGKTVQANGARYSLTAKNEYSSQEAVTLDIKLSKGVGAPSMIINTAAHIKAPNVYGQHLMQIALQPGGTGNYPLATKAYAENYTRVGEGITDITICTTTQ